MRRRLALTLQITLLCQLHGATAKDEDRCQTLSSVKAVDDLFGGRVGVRVLALVPDEGKAAASATLGQPEKTGNESIARKVERPKAGG